MFLASPLPNLYSSLTLGWAEDFFPQTTLVEAAKPGQVGFLNTPPGASTLSAVSSHDSNSSKHMGLVGITVYPRNPLQCLSNTLGPPD